MPSKTSFFNWGVFKKNMQRFWLVPALLFLFLYLSLIQMGRYFSDNLLNMLPDAGAVALFVAVVYGLITAVCCFCYLFRSNSAYMLHALPVSRRSLFWSNYLSGIVMLLVPMLLAVLIVGLRQLSFDQWLFNPVYFRALCLYLLFYCLISFFFYSFAVLCAMLTGNIVAMPLLYLVLNFTVPVVEALLRVMAGVFIYGMSDINMLHIASTAFSPIMYIMTYLLNKSMFTDGIVLVKEHALLWQGWPYIFALALVAVLIVVLCRLLYKKRNLETAGDVISHGVLRPVFKYCFTFGCAVVLGSLFFAAVYLMGNQSYGSSLHGGWLIYTLCLLAGAFIGYFGAEMMLQKRLRVFKSGFKGFLIAAAVILALCAVFRFDVFGLAGRVPTAAETESLMVNYNGGYELLTADEDAALIEEWRGIHRQLISERESTEEYVRNWETLRREAAAAMPMPVDPGVYTKELQGGNASELYKLPDVMSWSESNPYGYDDYNLDSVRFVYHLRNGRLVERVYDMPVTPLLLKDGKSSASRVKQLLESEAMMYQRNADFLALTPSDVVDMSYSLYAPASGSGEQNGVFTAEQYALLLAAMQQDVREGRLNTPYLNGDPDYWQQATTVYLYVDYIRQRSSGSEPRDKDLQYAGFQLLSCSEHTLEALYELGVLAK